MFLRCKVRKKNGKEHRSWSLVENRRVAGGQVVQRHVLYLGEINDSQQLAWRKSVEMFSEQEPHGTPTTAALFPEDVAVGAAVGAEEIVRLRLRELKLVRPRQWGACWLALHLWQELGLDKFWAELLPPSRQGTPWDQVLAVPTWYRLLSPGSVRIPMKADTCSNPYRTPFRACRTVVGAKRRSEGVINGCPTGVKVLPPFSC